MLLSILWDREQDKDSSGSKRITGMFLFFIGPYI